MPQCAPHSAQIKTENKLKGYILIKQPISKSLI
jgi:hypothetical protein